MPRVERLEAVTAAVGRRITAGVRASPPDLTAGLLREITARLRVAR